MIHPKFLVDNDSTLPKQKRLGSPQCPNYSVLVLSFTDADEFSLDPSIRRDDWGAEFRIQVELSSSGNPTPVTIFAGL